MKKRLVLPPAFKLGQRVKCHGVRGTVIKAIALSVGFSYHVSLDNGAQVTGTGHQFSPVRVTR